MLRRAIGTEACYELIAHRLEHGEFLLRLELIGTRVDRAVREIRKGSLRRPLITTAALDGVGHEEGDEKEGPADSENPLVVLAEELKHGVESTSGDQSVSRWRM